MKSASTRSILKLLCRTRHARSLYGLVTPGVLFASALLVGGPARAGTPDNVISGQTDLTAAGTYSGGLPSSASDVTFTNASYAPSSFMLNSAETFGTLNDLSPTALTISNTGGAASTLTLGATGFTNSVASANGGTTGDLLFVGSGASLNILNGVSALNLALAATGNFDVAGTATIGSVISGAFGFNKTGAGALTLSGANTLTGTVNVAAGTLNVSGALGTSSVTNGSFRVGTVTGTAAVMNILTGASVTGRPNLFIGDAGGGTGGGAVYQSGGTLTLTQAAGVDNLRIGSNASGYGYYNLSGGTVTANLPAIGASLADTVGVADVTGGLFAANTRFEISAGTATSSGLLNVTGGAVTAGADIRMLTGGGSATSQAVMNVGGGAGAASVTTGNAATVGVNLAQNNNTAGALSVVNLLTNGTLTTGRILGTTANSTTHFNFNGGTLKATAINNGAIFGDVNLKAVNVYSGGGTIDNSGTAITINRGLLAPTGAGVSGSTIAVASGGAGYIGAPLVKLTGGSGTGATGYATVVNGVVTGIVVTSPGIGYTAGDTLTATFFGGGPSTAATSVSGIGVAANTSGGMTFQGSGTTTLSGANTYTGATAVKAGVLAVTGSLAAGSTVTVGGAGATGTPTLTGTGAVNGSVVVAGAGGGAAGTINPGAVGAIGTLTIGGGLALNAGNLTFDIGSTSGSNDLLAVGGAVTTNGTTLLNLNEPTVANGTYTLITAAGGLGTTSFAVGARPAGRISFDLGSSTSTAEILTVSASPFVTGNEYWTGAASRTAGDTANNFWATGTSSSNWSTDPAGSNDPNQVPGANTDAVFTASNATPNAGSTLTTKLDAGYSIRSLTFDVPSSTPTPITSTVINTNGNTLTLSGAGSTTGNGLTLAATSNSSGTVSGSGAVVLNGSQTWANNNATRSLTVSAGLSASSGATTLTLSGTGAGGVTLSGIVGNGAATSLGVVFSQAGVTQLSGANTYTGGTTLTAGTLQMSGAGTLGNAGNTLTANGGTLDLNGTSQSVGNFAGTGGTETVVNNGAAASTLTVGANNGTGGVFDGVLANNTNAGAGTLVLVKTGTGTLTLAGAAANTYTGATVVNNGTLILAKSPGVSAVSANLTIGQGGAQGSVGLQTNADNQFAPNSVITFNSGGNNNSSKLNLNGTSQTVAGITSSSAGQAPVVQSSEAGTAGVTSTLTLNGSGAYVYDGIIRNRNTGTDTLAVTMSGTGTQTFRNTGGVASTNYTGATLVTGGSLILSDSGNGRTIGSFASAITDNTTLGLENTLSGNVQTLGQTIGGSGLVNVTSSNAGTVALSQSNTYTGGTTVSAGTLALAATAADGTGTLAVSGGTVQTAVAGALGSGNVTLASGVLQNTATAGSVQATTGRLTLNGGTSILDFGAGNTGAKFQFGSYSYASGILDVTDWVGNSAGNGTDQFAFTTAPGTTGSTLANVYFVSPTVDNGATSSTYTAMQLASGEIVPGTIAPTPEPGGLLPLVIGIAGTGVLVARRRRKAQGQKAALAEAV